MTETVWQPLAACFACVLAFGVCAFLSRRAYRRRDIPLGAALAALAFVMATQVYGFVKVAYLASEATDKEVESFLATTPSLRAEIDAMRAKKIPVTRALLKELGERQ